MAFTLDRLPGDWESYSAYDKINFFNDVGVTPDDLRSYGVDNSTIEWMRGNGYGVADGASEPAYVEPAPVAPTYIPPTYTEPEPTVYRENVRQRMEPEDVYYDEPVYTPPPAPTYSEQDIANAYNHYAGLGYSHDQIQDLANQVGIGDVSRFQPAPPPAPEPVDPYAAFHRMGGITYDEPSNVNTFVDTTYGVPSYGDMTGDLEVSGPGVMGLGDYILPTGQGVDLRDDINNVDIVETPASAPITDYITNARGDVMSTGGGGEFYTNAPMGGDYSFNPNLGYDDAGYLPGTLQVGDYVSGTAGEFLGGYEDQGIVTGPYNPVYEPNIGGEKGPEDYGLPAATEIFIPEGASTGLTWALNNGMDSTTYYNNIKDFVTQIVTSNLSDSDKAASLQAAMDLYGVSSNDISAATGQTVDTVNNFLAAANVVDPRISEQLGNVDTSGNATLQTTGGGVGGNTSAGIGYNPDTPEGTSIGLNARSDERSIYQAFSDDGSKLTNTIQTGVLDKDGNPIKYDAIYDFATGQTTYRINVNGEIITESTRPDFEGNVMYMGDRGINLRETGAADASVTVTTGAGGGTDTTARLPSTTGPIIPDYTNITGGGVVTETVSNEAVKPTEPQFTKQQLQDALNTTTAADVKYMFDNKMIDSLDADVALEYAMVNKLGYTPERAKEILSQLDASALRQSVTDLKQLEKVTVADVVVGNVANVTGNLANVTLSNVQIANLANVASNIANVVVANVFTGNVVNTIANLSNANVESITLNNQANVASNVANIIANNITSGNASNVTTSIANVIANNITVGNVSNVTANLIDSVVSNVVSKEVMNVVSNTSNVTLANVTTGNVSNVVSNVANANVANLTTGNVSNITSNIGNITVANVNMGNIANITANISNTTLNNVLNNSWFTWTEKDWNLLDSLTDTQAGNYLVDSNGKVTITNPNLANVPNSIANVFVANTSGNVSNVSGNITVANIGNITSNTLGNLFGNANTLSNANVIGNTVANIIANGLPNANVVANVLPNANVIANVLTNANVNANVIANVIPNANVNANVIANVIPNANVIANVEPNANVNANVIPNVYIPNVFPNVFPNVTPNVTPNVPNLTPNIANIGNISLVAGGLNPGWIAPTPFYQTTSPVQSQFYWGAHPYQPGPTFNETLYNTAPAAPRTPWGIQQIATGPVRYEDLLAQLYGRMPTSNNTANQVATPINPNYGNFSSTQPFAMPMSYKLLPTVAINPITTQYVANTGNLVAGPVVPTIDYTWATETGD